MHLENIQHKYTLTYANIPPSSTTLLYIKVQKIKNEKLGQDEGRP